MAAIALGVMAVLLLGLLTYLTTRRHRESALLVGHTYEVLASVEAAIARTVDAETGVRGFAATAREQFLDPYNSAGGDVQRELIRLRRLSSDNGSQQPRIDTLDARTSRVLQHLDSTVAEVRTTGTALRDATARFAAGKLLMDSVRTIGAAIGAEERRLLVARTRADARLGTLTNWAVFGETVAAAICVLAVATILSGAARNLEIHAASEAEARRAAEAANRAKAELLTTVSHELRTPLNAIAGYAQMLSLGLSGPLTERQLADIARISRANQHLTSMVTNLLNFARLEQGSVDFRIGDVELEPMLDDIFTLLGPRLASKDLTFVRPDCADRAPLTIRADAEKLRQILLNLLSNAIKFTPAGGTVSIECGVDEAAGVVRVTVRDTGRGIARDQQERIFDPFVQVDRQLTTESQQGVGMGLAISRDLAHAMHGELTVESIEGAGAAFTLTLPLAGRAARIPRAARPA